MHVVVAVTGDSSAAEDDSHSQLYQTVHIHWRIVTYSDIVITQGDSVVFEWDEFHSLSQVNCSRALGLVNLSSFYIVVLLLHC